MPDPISWDDADEIAAILRQRFPDNDPESVSELEIARWTREIPELVEDSTDEATIQRQVEAIRDAWRRAA
ncbi:MAG TPA: Fe-S cluster assembly protein IscX [Terriglobales bacterium]